MVKNGVYSFISIVLLILSILEIFVALPGLVLFPDILTFTNTQLSTFCSLVVGLLALPANIRLKFHIGRPHLEKLYGHTLAFKKLTILMYAIIHILALTICVCALWTTYFRKIFPPNFTSLMKAFIYDVSDKLLIHEIQSVLECCGSETYGDWLLTKWKKLVFSNDESYEEESESVSVPYSCCKRTSAVACGHYDLKTMGTATINHRGCASVIRSYTIIYLWFLFFLFVCNLVFEILLLALYYSESKNEKFKLKIFGNKKSSDNKRVQYERVHQPCKEKINNCDKNDMNFETICCDKLPPVWESEMAGKMVIMPDEHSEPRSSPKICHRRDCHEQCRSRSGSRSSSRSKTKSSSFSSSICCRKSTPVLTSSHKQIRILSPLQDVGNSPFMSKIRIFPKHK